MLILKILKNVTQIGILATYAILVGLVISFPLLYSLREGFFTLLRWELPLANMKIEDSLFPMFAVAMICVVLRGLKRVLSTVIGSMATGQERE